MREAAPAEILRVLSHPDTGSSGGILCQRQKFLSIDIPGIDRHQCIRIDCLQVLERFFDGFRLTPAKLAGDLACQQLHHYLIALRDAIFQQGLLLMALQNDNKNQSDTD